MTSTSKLLDKVDHIWSNLFHGMIELTMRGKFRTIKQATISIENLAKEYFNG